MRVLSDWEWESRDKQTDWGYKILTEGFDCNQILCLIK